MEQQLQEAQLIAEDSDKKYDIVSMKLAKFEAETERADDRLSGKTPNINRVYVYARMCVCARICERARA